jgi:hypothetical protein
LPQFNVRPCPPCSENSLRASHSLSTYPETRETVGFQPLHQGGRRVADVHEQDAPRIASSLIVGQPGTLFISGPNPNADEKSISIFIPRAPRAAAWKLRAPLSSRTFTVIWSSATMRVSCAPMCLNNSKELNPPFETRIHAPGGLMPSGRDCKVSDENSGSRATEADIQANGVCALDLHLSRPGRRGVRCV